MIYFREGDTACRVESKNSVKKWVVGVAKSHGKTVGEVCVVSCSDKYLLDVNVEHLNHNYYTDIISFDYSEGVEISGDLLISFDRVKENAKENGVLFQEELRRVIIHGVLHLVGYKDKTEDEKSIMRAQEDAALKKFHVEPK